MSDPIPQPIWTNLILWLGSAKEKKEPCQVTLHVNGDGKIVQADKVVKERVTA